jgi:Domain of unknown function DUF83.
MLAQRLKHLFENFSKREREPNTIYVTDLTACMRRAFLNIYFNASPRPTGQMVAGKLMHIALKEVLSSDDEFSNAQFEVECSYDLGDWMLKGKADVVTDSAVYEFKFTRGAKHNRASALYFAQVCAYCKMLSRDRGYLVLVDRESFDVDVLEVSECDELWDVVLKDAMILLEHISSSRIPNYKSPCFEWECKHCAWRIVCSNLKEVKANESL